MKSELKESRRRFLKLAPFAPLAFLAGCNISPEGTTGGFLRGFQKFNDWVQAKVFSPDKQVPEYHDDELTPESDFRVNSYGDDDPDIDLDQWKLSVEGLVAKPEAYTLEMIKALPKKVMNTRHVCVEGWSMIPKWGGVPLRDFLSAAGADLNAKYLAIECADDYYTCYDMPSALHSQTLLCYEAYNKPLTPEHGAPVRIIIPSKLGYKNAKWVNKIIVTNEKKGGYWEDDGYDWFAGI
ncbi:MAG: molybdopterin-dependent oxidoreductase [Bacteroidota bacterium]